MNGQLVSEDVTLEHLDWHDPTCAWDACPNTASWWLICLRCQRHTPWCDDHRRAEASLLAQDAWVYVECAGCARRVSCPDAWTLFAFIPVT